MTYRAWNLKPLDRAALRELTQAIAEQATEELEYNAQNDEPWSEQKYAAALAAQQKENALLAGVLTARGITDPTEALTLLAGEEELSDPSLLTDMDKACERIWRAIDEGETIVVFGDYDVDGVTATALLYTYLDSAGADVYYKLPSRGEDGYGLSEAAVELMDEKDVTLIITVDSGISAAAAVRRAKELGMDVVVTDHHLAPAQLPEAAAVVDPQQPGDESGCGMLAGAGVAFKLVCALEGCDAEELLPVYGDLAAIGTVADIMPLVGENRRMVKAGLALLQETDRPGLAALIRQCGLEGKRLTAENISFALAPRLNAAGRMDDATAALELLLCEDEAQAAGLAAALEEKNAERQKTEQHIAQSVLDTLAADPSYETDRILVVWGEGYHQGVIGIVASRMVEKFGKPAIVIAVDEAGEGKGSGRSVPGVSLYDAIAACAPLLVRYGGHAQAAGLSVKKENLGALRRAINAWAAQQYPVPAAPPIEVDTRVQLAALSCEAVAGLEKLAPFGAGNPAPLFLVEDALLEGVYPLSEGKHVRLRLRQGSAVLNAVYFGKGPDTLCYAPGAQVDVVLALSIFEGKAGPTVSARVKDMRPAGLKDDYLDTLLPAQAALAGAVLGPHEVQQVYPQREDTAAVYRLLAAHLGGMCAEDLRGMFARCGAQRAGKVLVSLRALCELGLVQQRQDARGEFLHIVPTQGKKDLAAAPILQRLRGGS